MKAMAKYKKSQYWSYLLELIKLVKKFYIGGPCCTFTSFAKMAGIFCVFNQAAQTREGGREGRKH
jgi:hypothetical protein